MTDDVLKSEPSRHYGNYRGEVLRVDDPLKAGRVKIKVFGVYDGLPENVIPWAIYADPNMGGISEVGSAIVPEVGAHVWVFFEGGDHHYPVYWAGAPAIKEEESDLPSESRSEESEYPFNKVRKTRSGILVEMDDTEDNVRFRIYHPSGTDNLTDNDGNEIKKVVSNVEHTVDKNVTRETKENESVTIGGDKTNDVTGSQTETVGGDVTEDYQSNHSATVGGDSTEDVSGSRTTTVGGDATDTVTGAKTEDVTGDLTENLEANHTTTVGGNYTQTATMISITTTGAINITSGGPVAIVGGGPVSIVGPAITLN